MFRRILGTLAIFQVAATAIYLLPPSPLKNKFAAVFLRHMDPIFYQNWHLFSPEPGADYRRLLLQCAESQNWIVIGEELRKKAAWLPFSGEGKVLHLVNQVKQEIWNSVQETLLRCESQQCALNNSLPKHLQKTLAAVEQAHCSSQFPNHGAQFQLVWVAPIPYSQRANPGLRKKMSLLIWRENLMWQGRVLK